MKNYVHLFAFTIETCFAKQRFCIQCILIFRKNFKLVFYHQNCINNSSYHLLGLILCQAPFHDFCLQQFYELLLLPLVYIKNKSFWAVLNYHRGVQVFFFFLLLKWKATDSTLWLHETRQKPKTWMTPFSA